MDPGFARTCPRSTSSLSIPRSKQPTLSPACPSSRSLRNISTPVTTDFFVSRIPTISISSPPLPTPPPPPRLLRLPDPHNLDLFPHLHAPPLDPPRHHRPPPRDRKNVLDRHQKRLVHRPRR